MTSSSSSRTEPAPDTLVAIATPPGRGGIGIVRLAGPLAVAVAGRLLALGSPLGDPEQHGRARRARVLDPADSTRVLDECLVTVFHAPHSYTGDTVVEIAAHGSPVVLEALVRGALGFGVQAVTDGAPGDLTFPTHDDDKTVVMNGPPRDLNGTPGETNNIHAGTVRLAGPGEFTQRAFLSGRLDLTQAEAVQDLIAAQTLEQARVAAQQLGGALSRRVAPAKERLLHLIALLEAGMDFASGELDDVDVVPPAEIALSIDSVAAPLRALADTFQRGQLLRNGAAIALVGRPNAGKSSLFNRLLERERAIVTALPGTTRDTLEETLSLGGVPVRLIDTAGLRAAGGDEDDGVDEAEVQGMARTHEALADADLVLHVVDLSAEGDAEAVDLRGQAHVVVHNKVDLVKAGDAREMRGSFARSAQDDGEKQRTATRGDREKGSGDAIRTSALTGEGMEALRGAVLGALNAGGALAEAGLLNNLRQRQAVEDALTALDAAAAANGAGMPHEIVLLDLHTALGALDSLTGATTSDDILARIFSTFCIGK